MRVKKTEDLSTQFKFFAKDVMSNSYLAYCTLKVTVLRLDREVDKSLEYSDHELSLLFFQLIFSEKLLMSIDLTVNDLF